MNFSEVAYFTCYSAGYSRQDIVRVIEAMISRVQYPGRVMAMTFFTATVNSLEIEIVREQIEEALWQAYGRGQHPPFIVVSQAPMDCLHGMLLEVCYLKNPDVRITYKECLNICYSLVDYSDFREVYAMCQVMKGTSNNYASFHKAFRNIKKVLHTENMGFCNVVRQWNYIGGILQSSGGPFTEETNYAVFNKVRNFHYGIEKFGSGYPAATGIGMLHEGIGISVVAGDYPGFCKWPLSNILQSNAYDYHPELLGVGLDSTYLPKFERALIIATKDNNTRILISGTASIRGMNTICKNDFTGQLKITFENIIQLIEPYIMQTDSVHAEYMRIYLKRTSDYPAWKDFSDKLPAIFKTASICAVQAELCRNDLLVEIECSFFIKNTDNEKKFMPGVCNHTYNRSDGRCPDVF